MAGNRRRLMVNIQRKRIQRAQQKKIAVRRQLYFLQNLIE